MAVTDPLGDMLTRIRNGHHARKNKVLAPASRLRAHLLDVLKREGYIRDYRLVGEAGKDRKLEIELKYVEGRPAIQEIARISKPGRRVYSPIGDLPRVSNGLGITVLSTSKGVMSDGEARAANIGGEVLCRVF
ncbi:MAG: 30S ribosomal protein S8 [Alphaproteobacteria bacterium]|nr:30S ribosomal protein S8 [Alphaproteobacteria bacterium]